MLHSPMPIRKLTVPGNFQPDRKEVDRIWRERADYGHFFYRVPNGESGADCADRCSSFNDSLWRRFSEPDMASVAIIVSHGMVIRCFLMRWYHFSVEYFEDLRNINHVEFIVMKLKDNGRYQLQNELRTWSELKRERAARASVSASGQPPSPFPPIPPRRTWGCGDDEEDAGQNPAPTIPVRIPVRRNTADLFKDDGELFPSRSKDPISSSPLARRDFVITELEDTKKRSSQVQKSSAKTQFETLNMSLGSLKAPERHAENDAYDEPWGLRGRDGGGSKSGAPSPMEGPQEDEPYTDVPPVPRDKSDTAHFTTDMFKGGALGRAMRGELPGGPGHAMADALGDQSDAEVEEDDIKMKDKQRQKAEEDWILADEQRDRGRQGSLH